TFNLLEGHVVPALIHKTYLAKIKTKPLIVWGSGAPLREFIFADDIARLSLWALENYDEEDPIIFSSGIEVSIRELVETVVQKMDFKGNIIFDNNKPDGQYRKPSDTTKLRKYHPDFLWTSLDEGIEKTINWFLENIHVMRSNRELLK
ncbi:MAG: NAD-dependent epimerase/dehydratase family protein, partial [Bacteroidetes bacterium]|nr:NAD-dependent epimerase/dehydratase family protein [Bacteroidota bacterium]